MSVMYSIFLLLLSITSFTYCSNEYVLTSQTTSKFGMYGKEFELKQNNTLVGTIVYEKIPFLSWYVIHSFYVAKEFRNKGIGSWLFTNIMNEIKRHGGKKIFVQPGPFELKYGEMINEPRGPQRQQLMSKLVTWYEKKGFVSASGWLRKCAKLVYKFLAIDEDSNYLLEYTIA